MLIYGRYTPNHRLLPDGSGGSTDSEDENDADSTSEDRKVKTVMIELTPEEYDRLTDTKKSFGFTWKGMLLRAHRSLHEEKCE